MRIHKFQNSLEHFTCLAIDDARNSPALRPKEICMFDARVYSHRLTQRGPMNVSSFIRKFAFSSQSSLGVSLQRILRILPFLVLAPALTATAQSNEAGFSLGHHVPQQVLNGQATRVSHYNPDLKLRLVMSIKAPHMAEEEQFLREQQTKGMPNFHKFLTAEEWNARFAPSAEDEQKVVDWAQSQGLTVTRRYSHRLIVDLEGTVDSIEKAFGVTINNYQVGEEVDFSNDRDPLLPASLKNIVTTVQGMNNIQRMHGSARGSENLKGPDYAPGPAVSLGGNLQKDGDATKLPASSNLNGNSVSSLNSQVNSAVSPNAIGNGVPPVNANKFMDPVNLFNSEAYDYDGLHALSHCCNVHNDSGGSPAVSSIAIAGFGNFLYSDIQGFQATYPYLAYNLTWYDIDGTPGCGPNTSIPPNPPCATGETTEDIEWTIATSNSLGSANDTSHVYAYLGGNFNYSTYTDIYSAILDDNSTRVFTTSWSCSENYDCGYDAGTIGVGESTDGDNSVIGSQHAIFNQMAGMGWTLIGSSGDRGASDDCQNGNTTPPTKNYLDTNAHTSLTYPASDSDFVAAGGTQLMLYIDGTWDYENAWQGGFGQGSCNSNNGGSGGGVSIYFDQPWWQSQSNPLTSLGNMRLSPDISLNADGIGQNLYINGGLNGNADGTSVVAPELAGFFAQENTYLNYIGNICGSDGKSACTPVGLPTWEIYDAAINGAQHDPFYNMLSGCNSNDATKHDKLNYFCAGANPPAGILGSVDIQGQPTQYNLVSGWGSVNMMQLAWAINWELIPAYGNPSLSFSGPPTYTWYNTNQTVSWTLSDSGSSGLPAPGPAGFTQGWDSIPADPYSEPNGGTGNSFYSGPQFPFATYGCLAFEPNGCSGGVGQGCHTVQVEGWDNQGVTTYGSYGPLCYDTVDPTVTISNNPSTPSSKWYNGPVKLTLNATDPGGSNASGIDRTYYSINYFGPNCVPGSINFCSFYTGPFTISAQGQYTIHYFTEDNAGNFSKDSSEVVNIDLSSPVTTANLSGVVYSGTTYETAVTFTLSATDSGGSGISQIYYTLDGGPVLTYGAGGPPAVSTVGSHVLQYWSLNNAGTTGQTNTLSFSIESPTTSSLSVSPNPSVSGQNVTLTATVVASISGNTPSGAVTFLNGAATIGVGTVNGGVATLKTLTLAAGTHSLTVRYVGTFNFMASTSGAVNDVVLQKTTTTLASSSNPAVYGSSVNLTATVTPAIGGTPTGTVQFFSGAASLGIVTLVGNSATLSTSALAGGHASIKAVYSGDPTYAASTSSVLTQTITSAPSTTTLGSSLNPSAYGQPVTFTATLNSTAGTPTGNVTFKSGNANLGSAKLSGGVATLTTSTLALGTDSITASYVGVADFSSSSSNALSQTVNPDSTLTTISSSVNPAAYGASVTLLAKVTSLVAGTTPTGSVTFMNGTTPLGTEPLNGAGEASITTGTLPLGTNLITASYGGAADFSAGTSFNFDEIIVAAPTATKISSSLNPAAYNQSVTFTATVTSAAGIPTGTVTFIQGTTTLGSGTLNGSGQAALTTSTLPVGNDPVVASYGGATDFSTSNSAALFQVVKTAATTTTLGSSLNPSVRGQSVTFTSMVTSAAGIPTGTVTFKSGAAILGTGLLDGTGTATLAISNMAAGTHSVTASYGGAADYNISTSPAISQVVNLASNASATNTATLAKWASPPSY
jgi:hypothetical protein